ncbi:MAG: adenosylcobinamide amidohydrolase [Lachnospiraceae bacterium]|nr:adenosylcobinamide amidohydrolase [Lachnospiraceae bacterium]
MKIYQFGCGDELHSYKKSLVLYFCGKRKVLSTGLNHGGCRTDLKAVFNNDGNPGPGMEFLMRAPTYREHLDVIAGEDLGLDIQSCSGFCTAASMENASIKSMKHEYFTVTAVVTAGIQGNGGRIGDPACYSETPNLKTEEVRKPGTINIMLHIDADLPDGTLTKALVSCTEARVAAIQELLAPSRYSNGLATGSGTDGIIVVCNPESENTLTDAGIHSKLGEYIGKTVKEAVKEALYLQTGLSPKFQHDILRRMDRFGVTDDSLWKLFSAKNTLPGSLPRYEFEHRLDRLKTQDMLVTYTSLYAHLLDQTEWKLLEPKEAWEAGKRILKLAGLEAAEKADWKPDTESVEEADWKPDTESVVEWMVRRYMEGLLSLITKENASEADECRWHS